MISLEVCIEGNSEHKINTADKQRQQLPCLAVNNLEHKVQCPQYQQITECLVVQGYYSGTDLCTEYNIPPRPGSATVSVTKYLARGDLKPRLILVVNSDDPQSTLTFLVTTQPCLSPPTDTPTFPVKVPGCWSCLALANRRNRCQHIQALHKQ